MISILLEDSSARSSTVAKCPLEELRIGGVVAEYSTMRRVITAQNERGEGIVAIDDRVEPIIAAVRNPGQQLWQLWGYDGIPQLPDNGSAKYANSIFAPPGGYRVQICEFPGEGNDL